MAAPAHTGGAAGESTPPVVPPPSTPHGDMAEILPSLPLETRCPPFHLRLYNGFWQPEIVLVDIPDIHTAHLREDILLASFPKSGTTWLKALAFATANRAMYSPSDAQHPLRRRNPHDCVRFLEAGAADDADELHAPPVLLAATHLPYSMLPERITGEGSRSRIVYICRNPKDVLVSGWIFTRKAQEAGGEGKESSSYTLQEAFDLFCEGRCVNGPHWQHALEYWAESLERPGKVLFLRYEEMVREPASNLRKLAAFMGCAFSREEEDAGVVDAIVELCSLPKLKAMGVNRNGINYLSVKNELYFRKGVTGDWTNHLTPEMITRLDEIVDAALQGSGLDLSSTTAQTTS
ncbi:hypothetical protein BS78_10G082600 [Paspalum vaginatum]|nr:hypothetical protein BS78_10G082600 [Paspalum vaginatum]